MSTVDGPDTLHLGEVFGVELSVYRRLDNRSEGLPDDSPRAIELHKRRADALHETLAEVDGWRIESWGLTDDVQPHELVDLIIAVASNPHVQTVLISGATWLTVELMKAGVDAFAGETVKALIARLIPKQKEQKSSTSQSRFQMARSSEFTRTLKSAFSEENNCGFVFSNAAPHSQGKLILSDTELLRVQRFTALSQHSRRTAAKALVRTARRMSSPVIGTTSVFSRLPRSISLVTVPLKPFQETRNPRLHL